jgi:hypothetical protein
MISPILAIGTRAAFVYPIVREATSRVAQEVGSAFRVAMLDLIEIELTRIRRMAEQTDDRFLLYLLDMAILEANRRARGIAEGHGDAENAQVLDGGDGKLGRNLAAELKVVR